MTKITFGDGEDDSKSTYHIDSVSGSQTEIGIGKQLDRSRREVVIHDSVERISQQQREAEKDRNTHMTQRLNLILAFVFGVLFIATILTLIVQIPNPTPPQAHVFSVVMALAAGGFASVLSGMLKVNLKFGTKAAIGATGALAVFVIVYFFVPAMSR
jgi:hypothetical protein